MIRHIHPPHPSTPPDCGAVSQWQGCWTCCRTPSWDPTRPDPDLNCEDLQDHRKLVHHSRSLGSQWYFLCGISVSHPSTLGSGQNRKYFKMHFFLNHYFFLWDSIDMTLAVVMVCPRRGLWKLCTCENHLSPSGTSYIPEMSIILFFFFFFF